MMRAAFFLAALLAAPLPTAAPAPAGGPAVTEPAIGRLNHAGFRRRHHCTMAAVGPRTVATAAHCVADWPVDRLHLLFGAERDVYAAHLTPSIAEDLGDDAAILCLGEAAPAHLLLRTTPLQVGERVSVTGYGTPRVHVQHGPTCRVTAVSPARFALDCPLARGSSGGTVRDEDGAVLGVASQSSATRSIAARIPPDASRLCGDGA